MPKVEIKGKVKHFPYTKAGKRAASLAKGTSDGYMPKKK